jgi:aspartate/methionine/tyrosine aminotransferase
MVISDEIYEHCAFGSKPFVPMGVFGEVAPVVTLGGISKRWMVPGWRLGWIAMTDPKGVLRKKKVYHALIKFVWRKQSCDACMALPPLFSTIYQLRDGFCFFNRFLRPS